MKIRKEQIATLNENQARSFDQCMADFLRQHFPDAVEVPGGELLSEIEVQTGKANRYGLISEQEVANYIITAWLLGTDFDAEFPAAHEVLTAEMPGESKSLFLEEWTREMLELLEAGG